MLRRTQSFVDGVARQAERHRTPVELILVDWNPPAERAPLMDVINWPAGSTFFSARVITVPASLHRTLKNSAQLGMFQMIAKNVGIRRAHGAFVIATNIDIIFSDELFHWLSAGVARTGALYRSDRWDIPNEIQLENKFDLLLKRARDESIRKNLRDGTYVRREGEFIKATQDRIDWMVLNWIENKTRDAENSLAAGDRRRAAEILTEMRLRLLPELRENYSIPLLHTNGCGDFTMMAREDWFAMRAYPEWHVFSWAIDSVFIYQAHYNGYECIDLPKDCTHYHIEHNYGSGWTIEGESSLWNRMDDRCIPYISYEDTLKIFHELRRRSKNGEYVVYNDLDWGFGDHELSDEVVAYEGRPARSARTVNSGKLTEAFNPVDNLRPIEIPLDRYFAPNDRAQARLKHEDGKDALIVRTIPEPWSYGVGIDVRPELEEGGQWWVKIRLKAVKGVTLIGVLNHDQSHFISKSSEIKPEQGERDVFLRINRPLQASCLMLRNVAAATGGDVEIYSVTAFVALLENGAAPTDRDIDAIIERARKRAAERRTPPLAPLSATKRLDWREISLGNHFVHHESVETSRGSREPAHLTVVTSSGVGAYAVSFLIEARAETGSEDQSARVQFQCVKGRAQICLIDENGGRRLSEGPIIEPRDGAATVEFRLERKSRIVLCNAQSEPSIAVLQRVEVSGLETHDFSMRLSAAAGYEPNASATVELSGRKWPARIKCAPEKFSYAFGLDLRTLFEGGGPRRVAVQVLVDSGAVQLGALNSDQSDWIALSGELRPASQPHFVSLQIEDASKASVVVLRNMQNGPSAARIQSAAISGPARFMRRVSAFEDAATVSLGTRARNTVRRVWESRALLPLRRAAPESIRSLWRKFYQSARG